MASGVILLTLTALIHHITCQTTNSLTPLSPCYSVFKVLPAGNVTAAGNNTMTTRYRYLNSFAAAGSSMHDPDNPDCIFTLEGPPNSRLQVQLSNVLIQSPGYVSTSQQDMGNCSLGAIRIYNFTITGALVQVSEVCNSFLTGNTLVSDTNVIAVTTTIVRGNFDVTATIIPLNDTGNEDLFRNLPIRDGNVVLLGHSEQEINLLSNFLNHSPEQSLNNSEINSSENDEYFNEYTYDDSGNVDSNQNNKLHNENNQQHNNKLIINSKKRPGQTNNPPQVENNGNSQIQFNRPLLNTVQLQKDQLNELLSNALTTMKFSQQQEMPEMLPLVKLFLQERENTNKLSSQIQPDPNTLISQLIQQLKTLISQNQFPTQMDTQHNLLNLIRNQVGNDKQTLASGNLVLQNSQIQQMNDKLAQQGSPITGIMDQNEKMDLLLHQLTQAGSDVIPQILSTDKPLTLSHIKQINDPSVINKINQMDNSNKSGIHNLMHLIRNQIKATEDDKNIEQDDDSQPSNQLDSKNKNKNRQTTENNISPHDHQNTSKKYESNRENSKFIDKVTSTQTSSQEQATSNTVMPDVNNTTSTNLPQTIPTPIPRHKPFIVDNNIDLLHSNIDTNMIIKDSDYKW